MAFLTVAGTTVPVAVNSVRRTTVEIGDGGRTFDGTYRETIRNRVLEWTLETPPITRATATTVYGVLTASTQPQTCAGDMVSSSGGSASCFTRVSRWEPTVAGGSTFYVVLRFELQESS